MFASHRSCMKRPIVPCKGTQDSLGFGIPFGFQVMIPDLCRWNLDSEFPSLVVLQTQDSGSSGKTLEDSGFQTQKFAGFRNSLHGARQCHIVLEKLSQFKSFMFLFICSRGTSLVSYACMLVLVRASHLLSETE